MVYENHEVSGVSILQSLYYWIFVYLTIGNKHLKGLNKRKKNSYREMPGKKSPYFLIIVKIRTGPIVNGYFFKTQSLQMDFLIENVSTNKILIYSYLTFVFFEK